MSYINKEGKTTARRNMIIRQQVSDVIAYNRITTTFSRAKETQKHVDYVINLSKKKTLASKRAIASMLLDNKQADVSTLLKLLDNIAKKHATRNGGYTRVLRIGKRRGDNVEEAILEII
ncbi:MAG: 50S ribosomal protein L17 [Mycoplasmataceae bacterium]|jgi:large subunit ribosomal protein L17|nr:50S ribosomal protein L17 [Mycoplasmataceae bacterium]